MTSFEEYINSKGKDFRIEPSAEVWKRIRNDLDRKKKRRFFILFFCGMVLSVSALLVYISSSEQAQQTVLKKETSIQNQHTNSVKVEETAFTRTEKPIPEKENASAFISSKSGTSIPPAKNSGTIKNSAEKLSQEVIHYAGTDLQPDPEETVVNTISNVEEDEKDSLFVVADKSDDATDTSVAVTDTSVADQREDKDDQDTLRQPASRFESGLSLFTGFSRFTTEEHTTQGAIQSHRNQTSQDAFTFLPAMHLRYNLSRRFSVSAGAGLHVIREALANEQYAYVNDTVFSAVSGVQPDYKVYTIPRKVLLDSSATEKTMYNEFRYLHLPIDFSFVVFSKRKINLALTGTVAYARMLYAKRYHYDFELNAYSVKDKEGLPADNFSAGASILAGYDLSDRFQVYIAPGMHSYLRPVHDTDYLDAGALYYGIRTGLQMKLR